MVTKRTRDRTPAKSASKKAKSSAEEGLKEEIASPVVAIKKDAKKAKSASKKVIASPVIAIKKDAKKSKGKIESEQEDVSSVVSTKKDAAFVPLEDMQMKPEDKQESSDDEEETNDIVAQASSKLATLDSKEGIIYLGHIPHGFYENQMQGFFSQFGPVKNLHLSRSKRSGKSRGYAFIQFESVAVAKIVQQSMDKYILCDKLLVCQLVAPENVHERMFRKSKKTFQKSDWIKKHGLVHNKERTEEEQISRNERAIQRQEEQLKKLKESGIDYEFVGYKK